MTDNSVGKLRTLIENGTCSPATIKVCGFWYKLFFLQEKINIVKQQQTAKRMLESLGTISRFFCSVKLKVN